MSTPQEGIGRRIAAPVRRLIHSYSSFFESLIHAVKNEIVAKVDDLDEKLDDIERSISTSHQSLSDQVSLQAATIRNLTAEVERLQSMVTELDPAADLRDDQATSIERV